MSDTLFEKYWKNWLPLCPSAEKIMNLLEKQGEKITNDHIALRTLKSEKIGIAALAKPFLEAGYEFGGEYHFEAKKLYAQHFEIKSDPTAPKVFISELLIDQLPESSQKTLNQLKADIEAHIDSNPKGDELGFSGRFWDFDYETFHELANHTEYGAWFYSFGFRANHFTIFINSLKSIGSIAEMNSWLKDNGFELNSSGGEIKGSESECLIQSSTKSDLVEITDKNGDHHRVPGCYIEFAHRFNTPDNKLYTGFVAVSADKIFESTNL